MEKITGVEPSNQTQLKDEKRTESLKNSYFCVNS